MFGQIILPWLHYLAVLMMSGAAVAQLYLLKLGQNAEALRTLTRVDRFYGITALLVLVTGLARVWIGGKGADYYWSNGVFHAVLGVFILTALVSLIPTGRFRRWKRALDTSGVLPNAALLRSTTALVHMQLTAIALAALLIVVVAKGYALGGT